MRNDAVQLSCGRQRNNKLQPTVLLFYSVAFPIPLTSSHVIYIRYHFIRNKNSATRLLPYTRRSICSSTHSTRRSTPQCTTSWLRAWRHDHRCKLKSRNMRHYSAVLLNAHRFFFTKMFTLVHDSESKPLLLRLLCHHSTHALRGPSSQYSLDYICGHNFTPIDDHSFTLYHFTLIFLGYKHGINKADWFCCPGFHFKTVSKQRC